MIICNKWINKIVEYYEDLGKLSIVYKINYEKFIK